jgi:predicted XRE-type DNA-binding protein
VLDTPCTLSTIRSEDKGYPYLTVAGHTYYHHRWVYIQAYGPLPRTTVVRHKCDNPRCINLDHLVAGSQRDNMHDMIARGRARHRYGEDHPQSKLTTEQVQEIRRLYNETPMLQREIATQFHISQSLVSNILRGLTHVRE